jgi:hypothetical protein
MGMPPSAAGGSDRLADGSAGPPWARGLIVVNDQNPQSHQNMVDHFAQLGVIVRTGTGFAEASCLLAQMRQSRRLSRREHIAWQNKGKLAHPTRFERVTFAFGEQLTH